MLFCSSDSTLCPGRSRNITPSSMDTFDVGHRGLMTERVSILRCEGSRCNFVHSCDRPPPFSNCCCSSPVREVDDVRSPAAFLSLLPLVAGAGGQGRNSTFRPLPTKCGARTLRTTSRAIATLRAANSCVGCEGLTDVLTREEVSPAARAATSARAARRAPWPSANFFIEHALFAECALGVGAVSSARSFAALDCPQ